MHQRCNFLFVNILAQQACDDIRFDIVLCFLCFFTFFASFLGIILFFLIILSKFGLAIMGIPSESFWLAAVTIVLLALLLVL